MTRDAEMSARDFVTLVLASLPGETDSTLLRTLLAQLPADPAPLRRPGSTASRPRRGGRRAARPGRRPPHPAATPSSSWSGRMPRSSAVATTRHTCVASSTARRSSTGSPSTPTCGGACSPRSPPCGAATADDIDAELRARQHRDRSRARRAGPRGLPHRRGQGRPRGAAASRSRPAQHGRSRPSRGLRRPSTTPTLLEPYVEKYHAMLDTVETKGSHAIIEVLVRGFYPTAPGRRAPPRRDAGLADRPPRRPGGARRLVAENRDPIARALRAQQRDADA